MYEVITLVSLWAIPMLIAFIPLYGWIRRVPIYESFTDGAKEGFGTAISIIPHLVAMMVAISIFRESGALEWMIRGLSPIFNLIGVPGDILPLAMLRPITGTGALAVTTDIMNQFGPDSFLGRLASTMQGSTDTTLFILTVYFGAVGIRKARYALKVGLLADLAGVTASLLICYAVFG
jgi:spore maturation protein B